MMQKKKNIKKFIILIIIKIILYVRKRKTCTVIMDIREKKLKMRKNVWMDKWFCKDVTLWHQLPAHCEWRKEKCKRDMALHKRTSTESFFFHEKSKKRKKRRNDWEKWRFVNDFGGFKCHCLNEKKRSMKEMTEND